jgi:hypothetical protein
MRREEPLAQVKVAGPLARQALDPSTAGVDEAALEQAAVPAGALADPTQASTPAPEAPGAVP